MSHGKPIVIVLNSSLLFTYGFMWIVCVCNKQSKKALDRFFERQGEKERNTAPAETGAARSIYTAFIIETTLSPPLDVCTVVSQYRAQSAINPLRLSNSVPR